MGLEFSIRGTGHHCCKFKETQGMPGFQASDSIFQRPGGDVIAFAARFHRCLVCCAALNSRIESQQATSHSSKRQDGGLLDNSKTTHISHIQTLQDRYL